MINVKTRQQFLENVKLLLPPSPICAEIGVLHGDFSSLILQYLSPGRLFLIDPWNNSSDKNSDEKYGVNLNFLNTAYSNETDYNKIKNKFSREIQSDVVSLKREFSYDAASHFPNQFFDFIYIDACHLYPSVKADLSAYLKKLKPNGLMCGHDYHNYEAYPEFGVIQAVDEFTSEHNFSMIILSDEADWALKNNNNV